MKCFKFANNSSVIANFTPTASIDKLEREVGVYSATPEFVRTHCGDIAKSILGAIPASYYELCSHLGLYPNCDIRIHRLYPGDYPAYPGWHCDGEFRETYFSQPDLDKIPVSYHLTATVSSHENGISNTQFLKESFEFQTIRDYSMRDTQDQHTMWSEVNELLEKRKDKDVWNTRDGQLVQFDARTLHRAMPAMRRGWRLFFRMSMWHKPNLGINNNGMVTKQEQVYKILGPIGW
jgi:hypothetical protein